MIQEASINATAPALSVRYNRVMMIMKSKNNEIVFMGVSDLFKWAIHHHHGQMIMNCRMCPSAIKYFWNIIYHLAGSYFILWAAYEVVCEREMEARTFFSYKSLRQKKKVLSPAIRKMETSKYLFFRVMKQALHLVPVLGRQRCPAKANVSFICFTHSNTRRIMVRWMG